MESWASTNHWRIGKQILLWLPENETCFKSSQVYGSSSMCCRVNMAMIVGFGGRSSCVLGAKGTTNGSEQPVVQAVEYLLITHWQSREWYSHRQNDESIVRMRIDGILHRVHRMPKVVHPAKYLDSKPCLDWIAERRRPQDGRFKTNTKLMSRLRISTAPLLLVKRWWRDLILVCWFKTLNG